VADRRGRPLWLHLTQAFELLPDALPPIAAAIGDLLAEAGAAPEVILVFDRGGYSAPLFQALNAMGIGWITWLKGAVQRPAATFTDKGNLPASERHPDQPGRAICYGRTTHAVTGLNDHVPATVWHDEGDSEHQVALLSNLDARFPGKFTALEQIGMLKARWNVENVFKAMTGDFDLDWTNGYAHEAIGATEVPNPQVRELRRLHGRRVVQLRRAMNRADVRRTPKAALRYKRKVATLKGQVTRVQNRLAHTPETVPYAELARPATTGLQHGRGVLLPVLRAAAYHIKLQLRDAVQAVFADQREWDKVITVVLNTPGYYVPGAEADRVILDPAQDGQQPRYRLALERLVTAANANPPHAPGRPDHPLRYQLASAGVIAAPVHNAPSGRLPE